MAPTNKFPSEFLQKVSTHLSLQDCYNCLFVCRFWHHTFQRALYKKVYVYSDTQFEELINSLSKSQACQEDYHNGYLIKELHLVSTLPHETTAYNEDTALNTQQKHIQLYQQTFELLNKLCPSLEVIAFDISQWDNIDLNKTTVKWKQMRACAPVRFSDFVDTAFLSVFGSNLTTVHISHFPEDLKSLVEKLSDLLTIEDLTLEILFNDNTNSEDSSNNIMALPFSNYLEKMHTSLPRLKNFNFVRSKTPHHEPPASLHDRHFLSPFVQPSQLQSLSLHGHVDSIKWFEFIGQSYPHLHTLKLTQLTTSRFGTKWMWQHALVQMIQSLPTLKSLFLGGRNVPQLFSKSLALELKKPECSIENLYVDFQTYQAIESCQFLLVVASYGLHQLRHLRLRVWEQIPGWSGVTSNLFQCQQLVSLELSLSKGLMDQFPFTSFLIDNFLDHLPQLEKLSLTGANVQVTYNNFVDLDFGKSFTLRSLQLNSSKVENHEAVLRYLSTCCPKLNLVSFRKCEIDKKKANRFPLLNACTIDLRHSELDKIVLSSLLIYMGTIQSNDFVGIQIKKKSGDDDGGDKKINREIGGDRSKDTIIWCSAIKSMGSYVYPQYSISDDQEKNNELDDVYNAYKSSHPLADLMPGNYTPTIGFFTVYCKSVTEVFLDNLKIPKKKN